METEKAFSVGLTTLAGSSLVTSLGLFINIMVTQKKENETAVEKSLFRKNLFLMFLLFIIFPILFFVRLKFFSNTGFLMGKQLMVIDALMSTLFVCLAFATLIGTSIKFEPLK
jgi:hypothetical protein